MVVLLSGDTRPAKRSACRSRRIPGSQHDCWPRKAFPSLPGGLLLTTRTGKIDLPPNDSQRPRMHALRQAAILFAILISMMTLLSTAQTLTYPQARRGDQVDDYHGTKVADPYRWLEDTDSAETHARVQDAN